MSFMIYPLFGYSEKETHPIQSISIDSGDMIISFPKGSVEKEKKYQVAYEEVKIGRRTTIEECYKLILYFIFSDDKRKEEEKI